MSMTLSSATAAAKAAQAELTAPVAANNGAAGSNAAGNGKTSVAKADPANGNGGNGGNANHSGKTAAAASPAPARPVQGGQSKTPAQSGASANASQATAQQQQQPAAGVAPAATPLFAQLLNVAVSDTAPGDTPAADNGDGKTDSTDGSVAADGVLPAMVSSLLNLAAAPVATPAPAPAPVAAPAAGDAADAGRIDSISATATLNPGATRLNLAAANVAVTPAAQLADAAAAAQASAASAAIPQNVYSLANNATLAAAAARQAQADAATSADSKPADNVAAAPAPVDADAAADAAVLSLPTQGTPRTAPRATDVAASSDAAAAPALAGNFNAGAKDDSGNRGVTLGTPAAGSITVSQSGAPASGQAAATVKLAGAPEQWQQPLREALGDRLQVQLQRNNDHAVIRLEPPNMGSIEISIRHSAGALQVNLSANNSEVVRQLNTIGDSVRQDLSNRQFSDVAVTVSSSRAQAQADQGGRNGQQRGQEDQRTPGRALSEDDSNATFAMTDRE